MPGFSPGEEYVDVSLERNAVIGGFDSAIEDAIICIKADSVVDVVGNVINEAEK